MNFIKKCFPKFYNTSFYRTLLSYWSCIELRFSSEERVRRILKHSLSIGCGEPAAKFFCQNQDRLGKVASLFFDEKSKEIYLKIVKYRQTFKFSDYPESNYPTSKKGGYFRNSFFKYRNSEALIDCGAYNGDTIEEFLSANIGYEKIVAFEPEPQNFEILKKSYSENSKIMLVNAGAYSKDGVLYFSGSGASGVISEKPKGINGETSINVRSIDGLHLQEKVTFIKMDIEGSELNALIGAKETILRWKPKLAICIYHSNEDMVRIAEYIHEIAPEYKLYARHCSKYPHAYDTVLYATM